MVTVTDIRRLCDPYGGLADMDCVSGSHLLHFLCEEHGIEHTLHMGDSMQRAAVRNMRTGSAIFFHMWLEVATKEGACIIDYHVRTWIGSKGNVPHGVSHAHVSSP